MHSIVDALGFIILTGRYAGFKVDDPGNRRNPVKLVGGITPHITEIDRLGDRAVGVLRHRNIFECGLDVGLVERGIARDGAAPDRCLSLSLHRRTERGLETGYPPLQIITAFLRIQLQSQFSEASVRCISRPCHFHQGRPTIAVRSVSSHQDRPAFAGVRNCFSMEALTFVAFDEVDIRIARLLRLVSRQMN